jgi:hypothetical protein
MLNSSIKTTNLLLKFIILNGSVHDWGWDLGPYSLQKASPDASLPFQIK